METTEQETSSSVCPQATTTDSVATALDSIGAAVGASLLIGGLVMQYLSKTVPIYECGKCGATGRLEGMCECCNVTVRYYDDEPATYWSVAVYETGLNYGGPEEGGWWYECGWLIDPHKQRVFDSLEQAVKYHKELLNHYKDTKNIAVHGSSSWLPCLLLRRKSWQNVCDSTTMGI